MIVDLEEKEESGWFDLEGGGSVELRLFSADEMREMMKAVTTKTVEYPLLPIVIDGKETDKKARMRFEGTEIDYVLLNRLMWDKNIKGWKGLFDRNGKEIPVTAENKALLMLKSDLFAQTVNDGLKVLKEQEQARQKELEKNVSTS